MEKDMAWCISAETSRQNSSSNMNSTRSAESNTD
jgi:hypothetical protein